MADFVFLMHGDAQERRDWAPYLASLRESGALKGGSSIGGGVAVRKDGAARAISAGIVGFIRIEADDLAHARTLLAGNPVYEAGGTVEIRDLPRDG